MKTAVSMIMAVTMNGVIGHRGTLPWQLPSEMQLFKAITMGKPIVMGRKTWDGFHGQPLAHRTSYVVSRELTLDKAYDHRAVVAKTPNEGLQAAVLEAEMRGVNEVCIIGGAQIYGELLPYVNKVYLTTVLWEMPPPEMEPETLVTFDVKKFGETKLRSRLKSSKTSLDTHEYMFEILTRTPSVGVMW